MDCINFEQANKVLKAPPGMRDCVDAHAYVADGRTVTCWQPNAEERAAIAAGAPVWLMVFHEGMFPCSVSGLTPFIESEPSDLRREEIEDGAPHCGNCCSFDKTAQRCARYMRTTFAHYWCMEHEGIRPTSGEAS